MLTLDPLTLPHIAAMCRQVDDGDDGVLPILADALEEVGDQRLAGLRLALQRQKSPSVGAAIPPDPPPAAWEPVSHWHPEYEPGVLRLEVFARLGGEESMGYKWYPTRSAAFLALAQALIG